MHSRFGLSLLSFCLLLACSDSAWAKSKRKKHFKPAKKLSCPAGLSNLGPASVPYKTFKLDSGEKILICVFPEAMENGKLKGKYLYQYEASLFRKDKFVSRVFSGSQKTPVSFRKKEGHLHEVMHLNFRNEFYPLYSEKIFCEKDECKRTDKTCVFDQNQLSPLGPKEFEREKVIYAKGVGQIQEMTDADLAQMSNLALRGHKLAVGFFTELQPRPIMQGLSAEFYQHMQALLREMTAAGCLQVE
ncbi:MAG: hypothetical protein ACXWC9_05240 [Pseudobdellovibrionaceae bacterium]